MIIKKQSSSQTRSFNITIVYFNTLHIYFFISLGPMMKLPTVLFMLHMLLIVYTPTIVTHSCEWVLATLSISDAEMDLFQRFFFLLVIEGVSFLDKITVFLSSVSTLQSAIISLVCKGCIINYYIRDLGKKINQFPRTH